MREEYQQWRRDPATYPEPARIDVGVITPYRSQRDLIRQTFERLLGPESLQEARIETVDSFQVCMRA